MAITLKNWTSLTNDERVEHVQSGKIMARQQIGTVEDENGEFKACFRWVASCKGIVIGQGEDKQEAIRSGYKWLGEYKGDLPN